MSNEEWKKTFNDWAWKVKSMRFPEQPHYYHQSAIDTLASEFLKLRAWVHSFRSNDQELIDYIEKKRIEIIKFLTDADDKEDAERYRSLLNELKKEPEQNVKWKVGQYHGVQMFDMEEKKKPLWKRLLSKK